MSGKSRARKTGKSSVSAHPVFPVIVALWCAALLGMGSLVLPIALFERLSEAAGLPAIFAAAQPPLGVTARTVIALFAAIVGALAGLAIGRGLAPRNRMRREASDESTGIEFEAELPAAAVKPPILAIEELGEGGFDADVSAGDVEGNADEIAAPIEGSFGSSSSDPAPTRETPKVDEERETPEMGDELETACTVQEKSETIERSLVEAPAPGCRDGVTSDEVAIVDLVDRFARALQRHREVAQVDAGEAAPVENGAGVERAIEPVEPLSFHEKYAQEVGGFDDGEEEVEDASDESYPSLLTMKSPFGLPREPVRFDHGDDCDASDMAAEPAVVFADQPATTPAAPATDKAHAETALRQALEKLQRMSGAA